MITLQQWKDCEGQAFALENGDSLTLAEVNVPVSPEGWECFSLLLRWVRRPCFWCRWGRWAPAMAPTISRRCSIASLPAHKQVDAFVFLLLKAQPKIESPRRVVGFHVNSQGLAGLASP